MGRLRGGRGSVLDLKEASEAIERQLSGLHPQGLEDRAGGVTLSPIVRKVATGGW